MELRSRGMEQGESRERTGLAQLINPKTGATQMPKSKAYDVITELLKEKT